MLVLMKNHPLTAISTVAGAWFQTFINHQAIVYEHSVIKQCTLYLASSFGYHINTGTWNNSVEFADCLPVKMIFENLCATNLGNKGFW